MSKEFEVKSLKNELEIVNSETARKNLHDLVVMFYDFANRVKDGLVTPEEYDYTKGVFDDFVCCDKQLYGVSTFGDLIMLLIDKLDTDSKMRKVRKSKGAYSVPDKVIDGVIRNIVYGEKVSDACSFAGISTVTLYNRIRDRGYNDIKKFFKDIKRSLKEEN